MIQTVIEVTPLDGYRLWTRFRDRTTGTIDIAAELWGPMSEPLRGRDLFARASADPQAEAVNWPDGADLALAFLYQAAQAAAPDGCHAGQRALRA